MSEFPAPDDSDLDQFDDDEDGAEPGDECGRWRDGKLAPMSRCLKLGTEECDWECPYREIMGRQKR